MENMPRSDLKINILDIQIERREGRKVMDCKHIKQKDIIKIYDMTLLC